MGKQIRNKLRTHFERLHRIRSRFDLIFNWGEKIVMKRISFHMQCINQMCLIARTASLYVKSFHRAHYTLGLSSRG